LRWIPDLTIRAGSELRLVRGVWLRSHSGKSKRGSESRSFTGDSELLTYLDGLAARETHTRAQRGIRALRAAFAVFAEADVSPTDVALALSISDEVIRGQALDRVTEMHRTAVLGSGTTEK
jgi:hypothetical protein